ncbi:hypothetical protein EV672_10521 [Aquabacterium commune]|uniref:Uncharacterized protein n=1 Tax=Aquabacterium commune TaxID=70586 RepID=A0A4R6RA56_9BURK|nr:hypothetical protein [Aquabacterium commune]TDP82834.1 hypothetical protein EV672_10521 [Aquabacterium commune]
MPTLHCLSFDLSLDTDGVHTFDAQAAAAVGAVAAVGSDAMLAQIRAEVQQVLAWASAHFPDGPGPLDEGCSWCHDVQDQRDGPGSSDGADSPHGQWHTVSLSLSGTPAFGEAFAQAFANALAQSPD